MYREWRRSSSLVDVLGIAQEVPERRALGRAGAIVGGRPWAEGTRIRRDEGSFLEGRHEEGII